MIAHDSSFPVPKIIPTMQVGWVNLAIFYEYLAIFQKWCKMWIKLQWNAHMELIFVVLNSAMLNIVLYICRETKKNIQDYKHKNYIFILKLKKT